MTVACSIQLTGTGLANTNKLKVQASTTTCSTDAASATESGLTVNPPVANSGGNVYALGTASSDAAGSSLRLCFAYASNYVFQVGTSQRALAPTVARE